MNEILKLMKVIDEGGSIGARPDIAIVFFLFFVVALIICILLSKRNYLLHRNRMLDEVGKGESIDEGI